MEQVRAAVGLTDIYPEFDSDRMADEYYTKMYNS